MTESDNHSSLDPCNLDDFADPNHEKVTASPGSDLPSTGERSLDNISVAELESELARHPPCIGKYEIAQTLGIHGQATVFKAFDPDLDRFVALKLYRQPLTPQAGNRLITEGRSLATIDSPFVARCYHVDTIEEVPLLVMEWVDGKTLTEFILESRPGSREIQNIFLDIANGLRAVHENQLLHRDLKPENIVVAPNGAPKIIDFGLSSSIAKVGNQVAGTFAYMAPELAKRQPEKIDERTDIFGLGAVLYFMLTEQPLRCGKNKEQMFQQAIDCDIVPIAGAQKNTPRYLKQICMKCLSKEPEDRFQNVNQVLGVLKTHRRLRRAVAASVVVALLAFTLVSGGLFYKGWLDSRSATSSTVNDFNLLEMLSSKYNEIAMDVTVMSGSPPSQATTLDESGQVLQLDCSEEVFIRVVPERACFVYVLSVQCDGADQKVNSVFSLPVRKDLNAPYTPEQRFETDPAEVEWRGVVEYLFVLATSKEVDVQELGAYIISRVANTKLDSLVIREQLRGFVVGCKAEIVSEVCIPYYVCSSDARETHDTPLRKMALRPGYHVSTIPAGRSGRNVELVKLASGVQEDDQLQATRDVRKRAIKQKATRLLRQGLAQSWQSEFEKAIASLDEASENYQVLLNEFDSWSISHLRTLEFLAHFHEILGDVQRSIEFRKQGIDLVEEAFDELPPALAKSSLRKAKVELEHTLKLQNLSVESFNQFREAKKKALSLPFFRGPGDLGNANRVLKQALKLYESSVGNNHIDTIRCLSRYTDLQNQGDNYREILPLLDRLEAGFRSCYGENNLDLMRVYSKRAITFSKWLNDNETALVENRKAIAIAEASLSLTQRERVNLYIQEAMFLNSRDEPASAVAILLDVGPGLEQRYSNSIEAARTHLQLAIAYSKLGLIDKSMRQATLAKSAHQAFVKTEPTISEEVKKLFECDCLRVQANCHVNRSEYPQAIQIYQSTISQLGSQDFTVRRLTLETDLAYALTKNGDLEQAVEIHRELLTRLDSRVDQLKKYPRTLRVGILKAHRATLHASLAQAFFLSDRNEEARGEYLNAIRIQETGDISNRPITLSLWYQGLGRVHYKLGDLQSAIESYEKAFDLLFSARNELLVGSSELSAARMAANVQSASSELIELYIEDRQHLEKIYELITRTKGLVFDTFAIRNLEIYRNHSDEIKLLHGQLLQIQKQLSLAVLRQEPDAVALQIEKLDEEKSRIEGQIALELNKFQSVEWEEGRWQDWINQLDAQTAIVEYFEAASIRYQQKQLYSIVIRKIGDECKMELISHGSSNEVYNRIRELHKRVQAQFGAARGFRNKTKKSTKIDTEPVQIALHHALWEPLDESLRSTDIRHVIISPVAYLQGVPWAILRKQNEPYVFEDYSISIANSVRDLRTSVVFTNRNRNMAQALLCGGFQYGEVVTPAGPAMAMSTAKQRERLVQFDGNERRLGRWPFLKGSQVEIEKIADVMNDQMTVRTLTGWEATEQRLVRELQSVDVAHLACHGFAAQATDRGSHDAHSGIIDPHPLAQSGLACSNANQMFMSGDLLIDGHLTGAEVLLLNLGDLELVTLSACESGQFQSIDGQGAYGIGFALRAAGARSSLTSLWPIGDESTHQLMDRFYYNWLIEKMPKAEALQRAQLAMKKAGAHPLAIGGWLISGDHR